jgi:AcrR family transcriptional regulator
VISQSETDKRKDILDAALKLFVRYGFHATPTSKIALGAGVANGTLFHYFKTKDELIVSLYVHLKTQLSEYNIAGRLDEKAGLKEKYRWSYINATAWGLKNPDGFRFIQQFTASPFLSLIAPEVIKKQTAPVIMMIEEGIKGGVLRPAPAELIYAMLTNHIYGMNEYLIKNRLSAAKQKKLIDESFEMLWKMIT